MSDPLRQPTDPRTREELADWLKRREELLPGEPLSAREYLMVERLRMSKPRYSLT